MLIALGTVGLVPACGDDDSTDDETTSSDSSDAPVSPDDSTTDSTSVPDATVAGGESSTPDSVGGDASEADYVAAFATLLAQFGDTVTDQQATCLGERWTETVGVDRMASADITPDGISSNEVNFGDLGLEAADADAMAEAIVGCDVDIAGVVITMNGADADSAACVRKKVPAEALARGFAYGVAGVDLPADLDQYEDVCADGG